MTYIFSELKGSNIKTILNNIKLDNKDNQLTDKNIIIIGNIIDSKNTINYSDINKKSFNLQNIYYCINNNIKLILGNEDLNKLKLYKFLQISNTNNNKLFNDFNNGNINLDRVIFDENFTENIKWTHIEYEESQFQCSPNEKMTYEKNINNINQSSNFITRFNNIFKNIMHSGNLLYSIPYEIEKGLRQKNNIQQLINFSDIENIISGKKSKYYTNEINYYAFIVLAIFKSLLNNNIQSFYSFNSSNSDHNIIFTKNSSFCKNWLYIIYMQENTSIILLYDNKYLLSYNGLTNYLLMFFHFSIHINIFYNNVKQINDKLSLDINNLNKYTPLKNININDDGLNSSIICCNNTFKDWIKKSYTDNICLLCILYIISTETGQIIEKLYPDYTIHNQYYRLINIDISVLLANEKIQYITSTKEIIQIFGNKSFNFANSFYKIDDKNMLISLDISNSFNYIYIDDDNNIKSVSKILLKSNEIILSNYTDIITDIQNVNHVVYYNKTIFSENSEIYVTYKINNKINYIEDNQYIYYILKDRFILNKIKNLNEENLIQLIYNGIISYNNIIYYIFTIIKKNIKNFYILTYEDIEKYFTPYIKNINTLAMKEALSKNEYLTMYNDNINSELNDIEININAINNCNIDMNNNKMNQVDILLNNLSKFFHAKKEMLSNTLNENIILLNETNNYNTYILINMHYITILKNYQISNEYLTLIKKYKKNIIYNEVRYSNIIINIVRTIAHDIIDETQDQINKLFLSLNILQTSNYEKLLEEFELNNNEYTLSYIDYNIKKISENTKILNLLYNQNQASHYYLNHLIHNNKLLLTYNYIKLLNKNPDNITEFITSAQYVTNLINIYNKLSNKLYNETIYRKYIKYKKNI